MLSRSGWAGRGELHSRAAECNLETDQRTALGTSLPLQNCMAETCRVPGSLAQQLPAAVRPEERLDGMGRDHPIMQARGHLRGCIR